MSGAGCNGWRRAARGSLTRERASVHLALIQQQINGGGPRHTPEELLAEIRTRVQEGEGGVLAPRLVGSASARQREIEEVFERASSLSADEAHALAERLLGLLGV